MRLAGIEQSTSVYERRPCLACGAVVRHRQYRHIDPSGFTSYFLLPYSHRRPDGAPCPRSTQP